MAEESRSQGNLPGLDGGRAHARPAGTNGAKSGSARIRSARSRSAPEQESFRDRLVRWLAIAVLLSIFGGFIGGLVLLFKEQWHLVLQFWLVGAIAGAVAGVDSLRMTRWAPKESLPHSGNRGVRPAGVHRFHKPPGSDRAAERISGGRDDKPVSGAPRAYSWGLLGMSLAIAIQCLIGLVLPLDRKLCCVSIFAFAMAMLFVGMVRYCVKSRHWMGVLAFTVLLFLVLNALGTGWFGWPFLPYLIDVMWLVRIVMILVAIAGFAMLRIYKANQGHYRPGHVLRARLGIVVGAVGFILTWFM